MKILNELIITGELSDRIVDNFIQKMQEKESSKCDEDKYRPPLSECNGTTLNISNNSQEKVVNVSDSFEVKNK